MSNEIVSALVITRTRTHACTDDAKLCFDSAGEANKSCSEFAGTECVNGECVCKIGYSLTTADVYVGNSAAAFKLQRTCVRKYTAR